MAKLKLKLVSPAVKQIRHIVARLEHRDQRWQDRGRQTLRHYSTPEAALACALPWLLRDGRVGSTIEIASDAAGICFATLRVSATGKISTLFMFKEFEK